MAEHTVARFSQELAIRAHYGRSGNHDGSCVGLSAVWIRLHQASPETSAVHRVNVVGSYDSMEHAESYQQSYGAALAGPLRGPRDAAAQELAAQTWGMHAHAPNSRMMSARATARMLAQVDGYAMVSITPSQKYGHVFRHAVAVHHTSGASEVDVFDPDLGEFKVPTSGLENFLRGFATTKNRPIDGYGLVYLDVHRDIDSTPLAGMVGY